jgi:nucleotide-binding universal stress UspA family protein
LTITPRRARAYGEAGVSINKIMAALDGSPLSETILPYVEEIAREMSLEVSLVRVLRITGVPASYLARHPYEGLEQVESAMQNDAIEYLTTIQKRLTENGLQVEQKVLRGAPAVAILDLAKDEPHDLICVATHGRSGITRWVIGSVAETLVRASNDPVLIIPPMRN